MHIVIADVHETVSVGIALFVQIVCMVFVVYQSYFHVVLGHENVYISVYGVSVVSGSYDFGYPLCLTSHVVKVWQEVEPAESVDGQHRPSSLSTRSLSPL